MRIKKDRMDLEEFVRLNKYIGSDSNIGKTAGYSGLKVSIENIGSTGSFPEQSYRAIEILIVDSELTRPELSKLMDMLYKYK